MGERQQDGLRPLALFPANLRQRFIIITGKRPFGREQLQVKVFMDDSHVKCRKCRHFYVTWDKRFPYGCRAAGFKSARLPSVEVFAASGSPCLSFEDKEREETGDKRL
ncbi:MAG: hypothetical protein A4E57_02994 [Syntrophorhabdaceae bacterium PtaU1.Bin034]|jgi:hypothetical protein|nr:MAG: hypothetical protein A4E57_02994 [Syntrophorhabdaceae bacterium PtaU1.Bin034]